MSCGYDIEFEIEIDPQKRSSLIEIMDDLGLIYDDSYWFTINKEQSSTTLHIEINTQASFDFANQIKDFITSNLHKAAKSTTLITEVCDGYEQVFAIGPDRKDCMSAYHLGEIKYHMEALTDKDRQIIKQWAINPS